MKLENSNIQNTVEEWLKPTLEKESLKNYAINISGSSEKGEGYLGDITFVEVSGNTKDNEEKVYSFVIKCGKKSKEYREVMPIREAFKNEIFFYNKILPTFIEFQLEKSVQDPFKNAPKCYDTIILEEMEVLILENIKKRGFVLHDRRRPMNRQHIKKVIDSYGKLHAISFALKDQKPEVFKNLSDNLYDIFKLRSEKKKSSDKFNPFQNIINLAKEENNQEIVQAALLLHEKAKIINEITDPADPYSVILHGDCWNNNFMFKYEDEEKLSEVCFLDFQISRVASPVYDLSYFLFTCLSREDAENFDEINGWYYDSLSSSLRELGSDPNKMFPFEELMNHWKKFSILGLMMMGSLVKLCLTDGDEVIDFEKVAESGKNFSAAISNEIKNTKQYRDRTFPIMELAIKKNFV